MKAFNFCASLSSEGVRAALGERFRHGLVKIVQVETKGEKTDEKILVSWMKFFPVKKVATIHFPDQCLYTVTFAPSYNISHV